MATRLLMAIATVAIAAGALAPVSTAEAATSTISGIVNYKGAPASNIVVGWVEPLTGAFDFVRSASDGTYTLDGPETGHEFVVYANLGMKNFAQSIQSYSYLGSFYGAGNERSYIYQTLTPYIGGQAATVSVDLAKPATLTGSDPALAGLHLALTTVGGTPVELAHKAPDVLVDETGAFTIGNLIPGAYVLKNPSPARFAGVRSEPIEMSEGTTTTIDPAIDYGSTITGHVVDNERNRLANVRVEAAALGTSSVTHTDRKGNYTLKALAHTSYRVRVGGIENSTTALVARSGQYVERLTPGSTRRLNIKVSLGARLEGEVPADSHTTVTLSNSRNDVVWKWNSSVRATFSSSGYPSGDYTLRLVSRSAEKYLTKRITLRRGKTTSLGLLTPARDTITISGALAGRSFAAGDSLTMRSRIGVSGWLQSTENGSYVIAGLVPAKYSLALRSPNRRPHIYGELKLAMSRTLDIRFGKPNSLVTARFSLEGKAPAGQLHLDNGADVRSLAFVDGLLSRRLPAGNYLAEPEVANAFPRSSPFWISLPPSRQVIKVRKSFDRDVGNVALIINGD